MPHATEPAVAFARSEQAALASKMKIKFLLLAFLHLLITRPVTPERCSSEWTSRGDSCYKWFSQPQYWFDAERTCRSHQGHLVSIQSQHENTLVARLAHCSSAWIGRFGTELNKLNHSASYAWTDGSDPVRFERHNFTQLDSVHKPLIRSHGEWWINSLYHERHPFVCERGSAQGNASLTCGTGWSLYNNHCYLMPDFESNFNEANFYCQRKSSQLVSVLSEAELNNINKLVFGIDGCGPKPVDTAWLGLIKLNPCFPDSGGRELCYQWTDFSGKHLGFPAWQLGHPNSSDWTVNCVTLRGDRLFSEACHNRHRFVCKSAARNDTDGGGSGGSAGGVVAAFDFRKGLDNLVDPSTYVVRDDFNVTRSSENGTCFHRKNSYYRIGDSVPYNKTFLSGAEWTIFMRAKIIGSGWAYLLQITNASLINLNDPGFRFYLSNSNANTLMHTFEYLYQQNSATTTYLVNDHTWTNTRCNNSWCNYAAAATNFQSVFTLNANSTRPDFYSHNFTYSWPKANILSLGWLPNWGGASFCISCFGIASKQMDKQELSQAYKTYCP